MSRWVVDTNVPIVANGPRDANDRHRPAVDCRIAAVTFLREVLNSGTVLVDLAGDIQAEYRKHLRPSGQPGVGDRFYLEVLRSAPRRICRIDLPRRPDGEYLDLPEALIASDFDPSDRKFAALAKRAHAPVVNATDSDWLEHIAILNESGIKVRFVCGCDRQKWFDG